MRISGSLSLFLSIFLAGAIVSSAGTYYVATNGDDSNGDGSVGNPWATLAHAVVSIPDDGSTVLVMDGT